MGRWIQRTAIAAGLLSACATFMVGWTHRHLTRDDVSRVVMTRDAELLALMQPRRLDSGAHRQRLGAAIAAGRQMERRPRFTATTVSSLPAYKRFMSGDGAPSGGTTVAVKFTIEECERSLKKPKVQAGLRLLDEPSRAAEWKATLDEDELSERHESLTALIDILSQDAARAAHRGEEEASLHGLLRLIQLSEDLLATRDPGLVLLGARALNAATFASNRIKREDGSDGVDADPTSQLDSSITRLLAVIPSQADRARIIDAYDRALAWIPTPRDELIAQFRGIHRSVLIRAHAEDATGRALRYAWSQDLGDFAKWQDRMLASIDDPMVPLAEEAISQGRYVLPRRIRRELPTTWYRSAFFAESRDQAEQAVRLLRAGTTK